MRLGQPLFSLFFRQYNRRWFIGDKKNKKVKLIDIDGLTFLRLHILRIIGEN